MTVETPPSNHLRTGLPSSRHPERAQSTPAVLRIAHTQPNGSITPFTFHILPSPVTSFASSKSFTPLSSLTPAADKLRTVLQYARTLLFAVVFLFGIAAPSAARGPRSLTVASYNVCNLFDTINDPGIRDMVLDSTTYRAKTKALARVIGELSPDLLALCEVENDEVLQSLTLTPPLDTLPLRSVHYDSPDNRGIDVALLYRSDRLQPVESEPLPAPDGYATRDVLRAEFIVRGTEHRLVFYVLHLPSRRGGYSEANRMRELIAAQVGARVAAEEPGKQVVVLGDLNANPDSRLIRRHFTALQCLTAAPFRQGQGSYAWRDTWQMYDHILVNAACTPIGAARVFVRDWMLTREGRFRGYPDRTISDHLPVYVRLMF